MEPSTKTIGDSRLLFSFTAGEIDIEESKPLTTMQIRAELLQQIFGFYRGESESRRKENWRRYVIHLKSERIDEKILGREKNWKKFMRSKGAIKEFDLGRLTYFLNYMPTNDLPYIVSTGREFSHSGKNFTAWLSTFILAKK